MVIASPLLLINEVINSQQVNVNLERGLYLERRSVVVYEAPGPVPPCLV